MKKVISLYCDESCHLKNNGDHVSMIGYLGVPHNSIKKHRLAIKAIKEKYGIYNEIKWTKVSNSNYDFHNALIKYFHNSDMVFRGLIIPTGYYGYSHVNDDDYYQMFYKLLSHEANLNYEYNIYIDYKDTNSHKRVSELKQKLDSNAPFTINNIQTIRSYESSFVQLADLILGAFTYDLNNPDSTSKKQVLVEKLKIQFNDNSYEEYKRIDGSNTGLFLIDIHDLK